MHWRHSRAFRTASRRSCSFLPWIRSRHDRGPCPKREIVSGRTTIETVRFSVTDAGRSALEG